MTLDVPRYNDIMFSVFQGYDGDVREYHPQERLSEPDRHQYWRWRPLMSLPLCRPDLWQHTGCQRCHPGLGRWDRGGQRAVGQRPYEGWSGPDDPGSEGESSHATIWGYWFPYIDWCLGITGSFTSGLTICRCMQEHVQWLFDLYVLVSILKNVNLDSGQANGLVWHWLSAEVILRIQRFIDCLNICCELMRSVQIVKFWISI